MRSIKRTKIMFLTCLGLFLSNLEAKAQTQENQNSPKIEKMEIKQDSLQLVVEGMHCQAGCANGIDSMLGQQKGIWESKTSYESGSSEIKYDKRKISEKEIVALIEGKGFKVKAKNDDKVE